MAIPNIKADYDGIGDGDDDANMVLTFSFMLTCWPDRVLQAVPTKALPNSPPGEPAFVSSVRSSKGYHGLIEIRAATHFFKFFKFFRF